MQTEVFMQKFWQNFCSFYYSKRKVENRMWAPSSDSRKDSFSALLLNFHILLRASFFTFRVLLICKKLLVGLREGNIELEMPQYFAPENFNQNENWKKKK